MQFEVQIFKEKNIKRVMRVVVFMFLLIISFRVSAQSIDSNKNHTNNAFTNRLRLNTLNGLEMSYYLNHAGVDEGAKKFYKGEISIKNQQVLYSLTDSLIFCNPEVRPFYFFIFNRVLEISDGSFDELLALKCKDYIERYPCDFFNCFNQPELNINVVKWTTLIGSNLRDKGSFAIFRGGVDAKIKSNCPDVQDLLKSFMMEVRMCLVR